MKNRIIFMTVVVFIILCMAGTTLAGTRAYGIVFDGTKTFVYQQEMAYTGYVKDVNTRCYFQSGAGEYNTQYTSRGLYQIVLGGGDLGGWLQFSARLNNSGGTKIHDYSDEPTNGRLSFKNSEQPGYICVANGSVTIHY